MRIYILILLGFLPLITFSQTENEPKDSTTLEIQRGQSFYDLKKNHYLNMNPNLSSPQIETFDLKTYKFSVNNLESTDLLPKKALNTFNTPEFKLEPIVQYPMINTNLINKHLPLQNDYNLRASYSIGNNLSINTQSYNKEYMHLGGIRTVGGQLMYQPTEWLSISGGPYVSKYMINQGIYNDFGFSGALQIKLSDNVYINGYGQYSVNAQRNRIGGPMSSMFNPTYYGGTMEFKINENWGIEAGLIRELNPWTGKWENQPVIAPKYYGGKKKR